MTPASQEIECLAGWALSRIKQTDKGHVRASRRGICGGVKLEDGTVAMFRKERGRSNSVRFETWLQRDSGKPCNPKVKVYSLPDWLERQAAVVLDNL